MIGLLAQALTGAANVAGAIAALLTAIVGFVTWRASQRREDGTAESQLRAGLAQWSQETIARQDRLLAEERRRRHEEVERAEERCRTMVEQLRVEFETKLAEERARAEWWKQRAQGITDPDATPPPDAREAG